MPDKLTDKEIVKALEDLVKCNNNEIDCDNCSLSVFYPRCPEEVGELALDLINRLEAEKEVLEARIGVYETCNARKDEAIKHLEAENERLKNAYKQCAFERDAYIEIENTAIAEAKAEAYKECIDMVKKKGINIGVGEIFITTNTLNNILKELVGEYYAILCD